jgi:glutathione S-transferase
MPLPRLLDVATSMFTTVSRLGAGVQARRPAHRPAQALELYEFEGCPFCRKVRDALTELDLEVMVYPCPKGGTVYRPKAVEQGGKAMFPYLVDPNTGTRMYESDDIIKYLFATYGGRAPGVLVHGAVATASSMLASAFRPTAGIIAAPTKSRPAQPLELWSFEASPFCRIAREALCELELPYLLHNVGKDGEGRPAFIKRSGKMMVPYLADPHTGREMFESAAIRDYLHETYGAS